MTTMNVSLPDSLRTFAESRSAQGYGSVSEYVRELIRADRKRAAQERLEGLLLEGLESGEPVEATPSYWKKLHQRVVRAAGKARRR